MALRAGIALSRIASDADFSITRVDGAPGLATYSSPTHHKLSNGDTVKDILNTFNETVGFDTKPFDNGFAVAYPISASAEQRRVFYEETLYSHDHFHAWANKHANRVKKHQRNVNFLFIDLTPGQVASKLSNGNTDERLLLNSEVFYNDVILNDVIISTVDDVVDKLITPIVPPSRKLDRIGVFRAPGAPICLSLEGLRAIFLGTLVDWVTLNELSYGAAFTVHRIETLDTVEPLHTAITNIPVGVMLADGKVVTILPGFFCLPTKRKVWFTTSQDNQTTITVRLLRGILPYGEVKLEGLLPRPKGEARIKVTFSIVGAGYSSITVEDLYSNLRKSETLGDIDDDFWAIMAYKLAEESR
ncbi:hypothetical protein CPB86DRAFT_704052 [Serendipita vermifera]|nr:hypothetical protein CPB86DRAFT_704052 [Serendipita vermifera]